MAPAHISQEQADEFAIGALEPESERLIALHIADCPSCREVVAEAQRVAGAFALGSTPNRAAPSRLRRRTFSEAGLVSPGPVVLVTRWARAVAGVAAVFVAAAAFTGMILIRDQVDDLRQNNAALQTQVSDVQSQKVEILALSQQVEDQQKAARELRATNKGNQDLLVALMAPGTHIAELVPVQDGQGAVGRLIWDETQQRLWFVAMHLPARPDGETYQIWVNEDGRFTTLGTFNPDSSGFVRFDRWIPTGFENYEQAVVTIEREGGATERSGDAVFSTDLSDLRR